MAEMRDSRWLLLIHQIPPKPDYFRVKIWRRLQRVGAVAVKNSVYVLPKSDSTLEDFQWILREITEGGGDASLCVAGFVEGLTDTQIEWRVRGLSGASSMNERSSNSYLRAAINRRRARSGSTCSTLSSPTKAIAALRRSCSRDSRLESSRCVRSSRSFTTST